jgi:hypothetical protein
MAQTLEDLLAIVANDGLQVNNLFQIEDGSWQANVRRSLVFHEFGRGATACDALSNAIDVYKAVLGSHKLPAIKKPTRLVIIRRPAQ